MIMASKELKDGSSSAELYLSTLELLDSLCEFVFLWNELILIKSGYRSVDKLKEYSSKETTDNGAYDRGPRVLHET